MKFESLEQVARLRKVADLFPAQPQDRPDWRTRLWHAMRAHPWFMAVVVVPTLLATVYYGFIAADLYVAEASFVVRSADQQQGMPSLGTFLQSVGFSRSSDDTFSVHDFIGSRDVVKQLAAQDNLKAILTRPEGDFLRRYPPFWGRDTFEQLYRTYKTFIDVEYDTSSGISTLEVEAFRPHDAYRLTQAILKASEALINRMNARARADTVKAAQDDVSLAEKRVAAAQQAITQYRLETGDLDPRAQAKTSYALVGQLSLQLANVQAQLHQLQVSSPGSPQIAPLQTSVAAMQAQLNKANAGLAGKNNSTATQLSRYESLLLEQEFATKELASATISLETARQAAARQHLYLEEIVKPLVPDYPIYPRRILDILLVLLVSLLVYGIGWLITASVREHHGH